MRRGEESGRGKDREREQRVRREGEERAVEKRNKKVQSLGRRESGEGNTGGEKRVRGMTDVGRFQGK